MKKAKVMLTAIAVFALVGGALAFKAQLFGTANVYCFKPLQNPTCPKVQFSTVENGQPQNPCGDGIIYLDPTCQTPLRTIDVPVYTLTEG